MQYKHIKIEKEIWENNWCNLPKTREIYILKKGQNKYE